LKQSSGCHRYLAGLIRKPISFRPKDLSFLYNCERETIDVAFPHSGGDEIIDLVGPCRQDAGAKDIEANPTSETSGNREASLVRGGDGNVWHGSAQRPTTQSQRPGKRDERIASLASCRWAS